MAGFYTYPDTVGEIRFNSFKHDSFICGQGVRIILLFSERILFNPTAFNSESVSPVILTSGK